MKRHQRVGGRGAGDAMACSTRRPGQIVGSGALVASRVLALSAALAAMGLFALAGMQAGCDDNGRQHPDAAGPGGGDGAVAQGDAATTQKDAGATGDASSDPYDSQRQLCVDKINELRAGCSIVVRPGTRTSAWEAG